MVTDERVLTDRERAWEKVPCIERTGAYETRNDDDTWTRHVTERGNHVFGQESVKGIGANRCLYCDLSANMLDAGKR